jgi:RHS repeat-associated protein
LTLVCGGRARSEHGAEHDIRGRHEARSEASTAGLGHQDNREGNLATLYDAAGNLTRLNLRRAGTCLPSSALCDQRFAYDWDEVGRLVRARRWDVTPANLGVASDPLPTANPDVDLRYAYDAGDERVIKTAIDPVGDQVHTLYIFQTLELRRAAWVGDGGSPEIFDYQRNSDTEVPYFFTGSKRLARIVYEPPADGVPTLGAVDRHIFFELGDHLGSTNIVIDRATGELVERGTYQAYGGAESDYRPDRWKGYRADFRFTGKEEDVEVGLQYFGKRFYAPALQRWVSADPLTIHGLGGDLNAYAYVSGQALKAVDPLGLDGEIRVNAAPEGVKEGQRFIMVGEDKAGEVSGDKFQKAAEGRQVYIYDPKHGLDPEFANAVVGLKEELGNADKGSSLSDFLVGAALVNAESGDAIKTGGGGDPGGVPGGQCTGERCVKGKGIQLLYVGAAVVGAVLGPGKAKAGKAASAIAEMAAERIRFLQTLVARARKLEAAESTVTAATKGGADARGGRGRLKTGDDVVEQVEGVTEHRDRLPPLHRSEEGDKVRDAINRTDKSEQRLKNKLRNYDPEDWE